jgi:disulfide bond formation protein DsbB
MHASISQRLPARRAFYLFGFAVCLGLLLFALYLQFVVHEEPCPLCIFQRVAMAALGVIFLFAAIHNPRSSGAVVYGVLIALAAGTGGAIAARHVWLQYLPPGQAPECGPGLDYMLETFPLSQTLRMVLQGSGECAAAGWHFLGLSIPEWTLLFFIVLGIGGFLQIWNRKITL